MPKFNVVGIVSGSKFLGTFEAPTKEEAVQVAMNSATASVSFCCQCSDQCEDPEIVDVVVDEE
jgi:hypothetical protein